MAFRVHRVRRGPQAQPHEPDSPLFPGGCILPFLVTGVKAARHRHPVLTAPASGRGDGICLDPVRKFPYVFRNKRPVWARTDVYGTLTSAIARGIICAAKGVAVLVGTRIDHFRTRHGMPVGSSPLVNRNGAAGNFPRRRPHLKPLCKVSCHDSHHVAGRKHPFL